MKKVVLLASFVFSLTVLSGFFRVHPTLAQTCTGSVSCETNCATIYTPPGCKNQCSALDPSCRECTGRERACDTAQVSCGFDNVWNGACAADCSSVGGTLGGGGCNSQPPPPPPPPPAVRYNCNTSTYTCYNAGSSGYYSSYSSCSNNCQPAAPPPPPQPEPDPDPPQCNTCGCPGQPACSCLDESNCGPGAWDCCGGACVPEGSDCCPGGNCCSSISTYDPTNVWLRVVSPEGPSGTTAWKSTQDIIVPPPGSTWSGNGLDAQSYFQTYQPYQNRSAEVFDKTKNKLDSRMSVTVNTLPTGQYKYTNQCGEPVTTNLMAHRRMVLSGLITSVLRAGLGNHKQISHCQQNQMKHLINCFIPPCLVAQAICCQNQIGMAVGDYLDNPLMHQKRYVAIMKH